MATLKTVHLQCAQIAVISIVLFINIPTAYGQESGQFDKGTPPQHAAGVSSLGSYTSADLGTINLSNGALNINLPLASVGGRGFSVPLTLNYSSKIWSANRDSNFADETGYHPVAYAKYADIENLMDIYSRVGPGWTIGAAPTLVMRANGIKDNSATTCAGDFKFALTKLSVMLPDKGEIQLRDDATDGAPLTAQLDPPTDCMARDGNRGRRWHATDGSGVVFISDSDNGIVRGDLNGVLILSDGTRYRFSSLYNPPAGSPPINLMGSGKFLARATSITDRNGNLITLTYPSANEVRYTDQLGRVTKIQKDVPDPDNPSVNLAFLITIPGYQGQNRYFKIKSVVMNQRYRPGINPTLPVINGDYDPMGWGLSWGTATRLFARSHGLDAEQIDQAMVMSELVLPDGRSIEFYYNEFGEVAEVWLPTGGKLQYDYQYVGTLPAGKSHIGEVITSYFDSNVSDIDRAVVARRTYADGATLEGSWTYAYTSTTAQVTAVSASGSVLLNQKHYFLASGRYLNSPAGTGPVPDRGTEGTGYSLWSTGIERRTETLDAAGTAVIAASEQDWTQRASLSWSAYTTYAQEQPENDNRLNEQRRYLDNGMIAKTGTSYDQYNNPTEVREYDFDQLLKRRTTTTYLTSNNGFNYATDDAIHLLSLPVTTTVFDGAGTQIAQSVNEYDNYTDDGNRALLTDYGVVSQHDSTYGAAKTTRGNVTRIGRWLKTTSTFIYSYPRFDTLGNVVATKDPNGNVTSVSFADDFGPGQTPGSPTENPATPTYALPTLITSPPPLPGAPVHTARSQYDYSTGLLVGFRDRNDIVTQTIYNDPFNRPTQVKSALGVSGVENHATIYYAPTTAFGITLAGNDVLTATDLNTLDDASIRSWTVTDGFGRTKETWKRDPLGDVKVVTVYDCLNRVTQSSNPFRPATETAVNTTTDYDLAGRVTFVTTSDGAVVSTSYSGNTVTVTDQAGKKRKSLTDALGRLTDVFEDPTPGLNYQTTYAYDVLDNLKTVIQGTQTRTFVYDSLKRLKSATNPESGTITYDYDNNSNLTQKTDARGIVSTYGYDALNRNTTIDYSDTTSINPDVSRFYDGATNGKGRLWYSYAGGSESVGSNVEKTLIDSYDALGRPSVLRQLFKLNSLWSSAYQVSRSYNRAGSVTSQTYPSGHTVTYNYDAAGRLADNGANLAFTGNLGDGVLRTYSRGISYVSSGALKQEQFGTTTPVYNKLFYNSRLQLAEILTSTTGGDSSWNRGKIINGYSLQCSGAACNATDNNGNLRKQEVYIPANDQVSSYTSWSQQYDYDTLNRLQRVHEYTGNTSLDWQQEYVYDRWGNRTIHQTNTWGAGINKKDFTVNTTNNRLGVPAGQSGTMTYDAAGNLTTDTYTGFGNRIYDAENKMTAAQGSSGWSYYTYNADGQRTRRKINNQETWQIYGFEGELLAEYPANGSASTPQKEYGYRNGQLLVSASSASRVNFANSTNGATVTAQNYTQDGVYPGYHFYPSSAIDGQRYGHLIAGGGDINDFWRDEHGLPSWLEVDFNGTKTIDEVDVFTVPECPACLNQSDPSPTQTFSQYGATAFDVQYWTGSSWVTVPGGSITGNNLVWRKINFVPITTSKIRVVVNAAATDGVARIAEVEAWGSSAPTNVALTTNGATVSAQNYTQDGVYPGYHFYPSSAIDGQRYGHLIAGGDDINGFWRDEHGLPSWLQVDFNSTKTIEEVDVFTVPECPACLNQSDPSPTQTFSQYGATAFDVQYWTGSSWVTVPGGSIIGNNLVWRKISFAPITTSKIRVVVNAAATDGVARIAEVEAWTGSTASTISNIQWLVTDHLGTPRMILDQSGSLASVKRHDYLPFGEELSAPTGLRASALGYSSSDGVRQQFTQKERDLETGLDYFGARYYASTQGRFTSVDPALTSASVSTPQSWNRYAYGFNNPLRYIDPTGAWVWSAALGGGATDEELRRNAGNDRRALQAANRIIERRNQFRNGLNDARAAGAQSDEPDTVARAVNAYGTENDNNGVTVTYGTTTGGTPAEAGPGPGPALTFDANGVATAQVLVTISDTARLDANALAQAIGHEGWHVADRQSFASYLNREIGAAGGLANFVGTPLETAAFNSPHNRTVQTTEFNAYIVSGLIAQGRDALGHNLPNSSFNGHEVWNRSWTAAERPGLRAVGAFEHVTTSSIYANKLNQRIFSP